MQTDGISQLLCFLMGGHLDIDIIETCQLRQLDGIEKLFSPTFGISGMRQFCGVYNKPLLGGIVKPKTGLSPHQLLDLTKQLVDGGVNFIKRGRDPWKSGLLSVDGAGGSTPALPTRQESHLLLLHQ